MMKAFDFTTHYRDVPFDIDLNNDTDYVIDKLDLKKKGIKEEDIDIGVGYCVVKWELSIETRDWGVKNISAYTTSIELELYVEWYDKDDKKYDKTISVDLTDFETDNENEGFNGTFSVDNVSIDFEDKTINVEF